MKLRGTCHCGATRFEVAAPPATLTSCNCTFCSKRGVLWAYYAPDDFALLASEHVATYAREGSLVTHHHCVVCGCGTWTRSPVWVDFQPTDRTRIGVNARLFDELELAPIPVEHVDGRNLW